MTDVRIPVRNTFIHFPEEEEHCGSPVRHTKSDSAALTAGASALRARRALPLNWCSDCADSGTDSQESHDSLSAQDVFDAFEVAEAACPDAGTAEMDLFSCRAAFRTHSATDVSTTASSTASNSTMVAATWSTASSSQVSPFFIEATPSTGSAAGAFHLTPCAWAVPVPALHCPTAAAPTRAASQAVQLERSCLPATACWKVHAEQIQGSENKVESGPFVVALPGHGPCVFEIILYAGDSCGHRSRGQGFFRSRGRGRVEVRCQGHLKEGAGRVGLHLCVGSGEQMQPLRPAVLHDFSKKACCGSRKWDFASAVDPCSRTLMVRIHFEPVGL